MTKYLAVIKASFNRTMEHRLNMLVANLQSVFTLFILFFFWRTVFNYKSSLGGYSFEEIVTYYFLIRVTYNRTSTFEANSVANDIKSGKITSDLLKPVNTIWYRIFYKGVVTNMWVIGNLVAIMLFSSFLYTSLLLPKNFYNLVLFILVFLLNGILSLLLNIIIGSLGFWITEITHLKTITYQIFTILSGSLIPLTFFPSSVSKIFNYLPFRFLAQFPADIYLGKLQLSEILLGLFVLVLWIILLSFFAQFVFKKGLKVYEAFN